MQVKIINKSNNPNPSYETEFSAGMDIRAFTENKIILEPGERKLVSTGLFLELPAGYEAQVRSRSGLALKKGISVLNSPGTIDSDYRGEIGIILINHSSENFVIENGDRVAQLVIAKHEKIVWHSNQEIKHSERGSGGFGSTGSN
jgi:dUTP pyrophosphatase